MKAKAAEFFKKYFLIQDEDMELYEDTIDCMVKFTEQCIGESNEVNKKTKFKCAINFDCKDRNRFPNCGDCPHLYIKKFVNFVKI